MVIVSCVITLSLLFVSLIAIFRDFDGRVCSVFLFFFFLFFLINIVNFLKFFRRANLSSFYS